MLTGILIGVLLTLQFRSAIPSATYLSDELRVQRELIDSYLADQALLKTKIIGLREQINEAQERAQIVGQDNDLETLKELKKLIGLESARGPGIEVSLDDGLFVNRESADSVSQSLVHAADLRDLVNVLWAANAEAIAINDQRIIASTPITSVGNTILVNGFHLLPPFTISAIGDSDILVQRLNDDSTLPDLKKRAQELKIQFTVRIKDGLLVPVYNANLNDKFINPDSDATI